MKTTLQANAKINLTLDVLGKRADGYHDVAMMMQEIPLADTITVEPTESGIELVIRSPLPSDHRNTAHKAAAAFFKTTGIAGGVKIGLQKVIPAEAGLAGGSADAAAVLKGMNELFEAHLSPGELRKIGLSVGADVPFCLLGGAALAEGVGERLTVVSPIPACRVLLCKPEKGLSTAEIYRLMDSVQIRRRPDNRAMIKALKGGDLAAVAANLCNVMEEASVPLLPEIAEIKREMISYGALNAAMSGSGPTVFGIFDRQDFAEAAYEALKRRYFQIFLLDIK